MNYDPRNVDRFGRPPGVVRLYLERQKRPEQKLRRFSLEAVIIAFLCGWIAAKCGDAVSEIITSAIIQPEIEK